MARQRFIQHPQTLELIPAEEYVGPSEIAAPYVLGDVQPYKSMITGEMIAGRRQHREHLRQHGCIEVGNEKITPKVWEEALFSQNKYNKANVTGQKVHGSLADYYLEQSFSKLRVEGKVFDYVALGKKRDTYGQGNKSDFFNEALNKLLDRDGKDALRDFDGIFFLYAGGRAKAARGGLYWPHKSNLMYRGKPWSYFICPEGGAAWAAASRRSRSFSAWIIWRSSALAESRIRWCSTSRCASKSC